MGMAVLRSNPTLGFRSPPPPAMKPSRRDPPRSGPRPPRPSRSAPTKAGVGRRVSFADKENSGGAVMKIPARKLVMEEVTILKRGDDPRRLLAAAADCDEASPLFSTNSMGPKPEILPKRIGFSNARPVYAGPAFVASPAPSSLPFPASFLNKSGTGTGTGTDDDTATKNLRCLLGLDGLN